jgi:hypothetical protein
MASGVGVKLFPASYEALTGSVFLFRALPGHLKFTIRRKVKTSVHRPRTRWQVRGRHFLYYDFWFMDSWLPVLGFMASGVGIYGGA